MVAQWEAYSEPTTEFGVALLRWPADNARAEELERAGLPFLLLVAAGEPPPISGYRFMDWVRSPVDPDELVARRESLEERFVLSLGGPRPHFDEETGRLTFGRATVDVGPSKARALGLFVAMYREIVPFADVRTAFGLAELDAAELLTSRLVRLRRAVRTVGLDITRVRGVGLALEPAGSATDTRQISG